MEDTLASLSALASSPSGHPPTTWRQRAQDACKGLSGRFGGAADAVPVAPFLAHQTELAAAIAGSSANHVFFLPLGKCTVPACLQLSGGPARPARRRPPQCQLRHAQGWA